MKKDVTLSENGLLKVMMVLGSVGQVLASVYSYLLEETVSESQAWKILHASVAFMFLAFASTSVEMRFAALGWFLFTLWDCKKAGLK